MSTSCIEHVKVQHTQITEYKSNGNVENNVDSHSHRTSETVVS